jgi:hypothetical protein
MVRKIDENSYWLVGNLKIIPPVKDKRPKTNVPKSFIAKTESHKTLNQATACWAYGP